MTFVVLPLTPIHLPIRPCEAPLALEMTSNEVANVGIAIRVFFNTFSMLFVLNKCTFIGLAIGPRIMTGTTHLPIQHLSSVHITISHVGCTFALAQALVVKLAFPFRFALVDPLWNLILLLQLRKRLMKVLNVHVLWRFMW